MPEKIDYELGETADMTGIELKAVYSDGREEKIDINDITVENDSLNVSGINMVRVKYEYCYVDFAVNVATKKINTISIKQYPVYDELRVGGKFNNIGLEATLGLNDGTKVDVDAKELKVVIDDRVISPGAVIDDSLIGHKNVKVYYGGNKYDTVGDPYAEYKTEFIEANMEEIRSVAVNGYYYLGDDYSNSDITVEAVFSNGSNKFSDILSDGEFVINNWDSSKLGDNVITISVSNPNIVSYPVTVNILNKASTYLEIAAYPATTVKIGEEFNPIGLEVIKRILHSNEIAERYYKDVYYMYNGIGYYEYGTDKKVDEDTVNTAGIWIDISGYDSSEKGITSVNICTNSGNINLPVSIVEDKSDIWKSSVFGASTSTNKGGVKDKGTDGVNIYSVAGSGKVTPKTDGITYYYTRVDKGYNFELSGDITVNSFGDGGTLLGYEAFGIMARDCILLESAVKEGGYVFSSKDAKKDENGEPIPMNKGTGVNSSIVLAGAYRGNDKENNIMNLYTRDYMISDSALPIQGGFDSIAPTIPTIGSKYNITISKVNGGFRIKCYDYTSGEIKTVERHCADFLTYEDEDSMYVGFFTARYADITVNNIAFSKSVAETDGYKIEDTTVSSPNIIVSNVSQNKCSIKIDDIDGYYKIKVNDKWVVGQYTSCKGGVNYTINIDGSKLNAINIVYVTYIGGEERLYRYNRKDTGMPSELLYGDADGDGLLSSNDCALIMQYVLNKSSVNMSEDTVAIIDVDGDGIITANDAAEVLSKVLNGSYVFGRDRK